MSGVALIAILGIGGMVMVISILMSVMFMKMSEADEKDPFHSQH
ncbi:hypothetical protein [Alkalihalobacterium alkalinitrilicum]|nr:hypothetical protein [Alkalihalobacterium alkalinitrilicum]